ncbi:MAG: TolC family protein [Bacteroidota bacterium]|nr:TolC family protein [Bacteroidota bacterium]
MFFTLTINAQNIWSLEDCIERAISENLNIKKQKFAKDISSNLLKQSRLSLLPSVNTFASKGYYFGRSVNPATNDYIKENIVTGDVSIVAGLTIFNGFQKINTIRKNTLEKRASNYDINKSINDISLSVVNAFLQVLFTKDLVAVNQQQLEVIRLQVERTRKMVDVGKVAKGNLLEVESQQAAEELELINTENQLDAAYLNIRQLLEISPETPFQIASPPIVIISDINFPTTDTIYQVACDIFPEIKSAELKFRSSKLDLAISKGKMSPKLSVNTAISTSYTNIYNAPIINRSIKNQAQDNLNKSVSFSLEIPIFNNWHVNTEVQNSKIYVVDASYTLLQKKNELRKQIEQARADVLAAKKQYEYAKKTYDTFEETFKYIEQKYNLGLVSTYEYNDGKTKLNTSESELVRSKYDYIFKIKIIDFYMGEKLNL